MLRLDAFQVGRPLSGAEWIALTALTAAATVVLHWVFAPGLMSFDSFVFYGEAVNGVRESTWPPMYAYLIRLVRALGGDYGTLFLLQAAATLFCGGWLAMRLSGGSLVRRLLALGLYFLAFVAVPPLAGTLIVLWNVVAVAALLLAGLCLQLAGATGRRLTLALAAALAYAVCFALRYNAVFLVAVPMLLLVLWPTGPGSSLRARAGAFSAAALAFALAFGSFSWRLPDLQKLPENAGVRNIQVFDLLGVSACAGENLLPEAAGQVPAAEIARRYDARHLNLSLGAKDGLPALAKPRDAAAVNARWLAAVQAHPGCYARHRWTVFAEQMGLARSGVFYPTHGGIDPNPFGYALERPALATAAIGWIEARAAAPLQRPGWLYLGALVLALLAWRRSDPRALPLGVLTFSAFAYAGSHLLITPAADARYIFPATVLCAVAVAAALGGRAQR